MTLFERLLLQNYGREGAAFINHMLEIYAWPTIHTKKYCIAPWSCARLLHDTRLVMQSCSRSTLVYRDLAANNNRSPLLLNNSMHNHSVQNNHMMTLWRVPYTAQTNSTFILFTWYGGMDEPKCSTCSRGSTRGRFDWWIQKDSSLVVSTTMETRHFKCGSHSHHLRVSKLTIFTRLPMVWYMQMSTMRHTSMVVSSNRLDCCQSNDEMQSCFSSKKRLNNLKRSKSGTISGNDFMVVSNSMELPK
jgi:hypothetical protein